MSRKITQEEFLKRFYAHFPTAKIEVLEYSGIRKPCTIQCAKCGKIFTRADASQFIASWICCQENKETTLQRVDRLCKENGGYELIKQVGQKVIIRHIKCGNENIKTIQAANGNPCTCSYCDTKKEKLRLTFAEAEQELRNVFGEDLKLLEFNGVDNKKTTIQCNRCGFIFHQGLYNLIYKTRGCPKCDQRRSRGERAMRKVLDELGWEYKEQVRFTELPKLSFDFGIYKNNELVALIEIQGDQHFREVFRYPNRPNYFLTQQRHDQSKRNWCKENGILLLEVINDSGKLLNLDILQQINSTTIPDKGSKIEATAI